MQQISAGCYRLSSLKYLKILKSYELKYNYSKTNILHEKSFLVALQGLEKEKKNSYRYVEYENETHRRIHDESKMVSVPRSCIMIPN